MCFLLCLFCGWLFWLACCPGCCLAGFLPWELCVKARILVYDCLFIRRDAPTKSVYENDSDNSSSRELSFFIVLTQIEYN